MGYKQPSSGLPFKEIGSSPAKITSVAISMLGKSNKSDKDKNKGLFSKSLNRQTKKSEQTSHPKKGLSTYDPKTKDYTKSSMRNPEVKKQFSPIDTTTGNVADRTRKVNIGMSKEQFMKSK